MKKQKTEKEKPNENREIIKEEKRGKKPNAEREKGKSEMETTGIQMSQG